MGGHWGFDDYGYSGNDMYTPVPKGGGLPVVHTESVHVPPPPSPDNSAERRKRIFDWPKRKKKKKD